jgi:hypothetical protein
MDTPAVPSPKGVPVGPAGAAPVVAAATPVAGRAVVAEPGSLEEPNTRHAAGFLNQPWVQNVLPLATSLFLHLGIIVLGIALYQAVQQVVNPNKEQVIIPQSASLAKSATPGGVTHPGPPADPTRDVAQDQTKDTDSQGFATDAANRLAAAGGPGDAASTFGVGSASSGGHGRAFGGGAGAGGTAPWGMPGGGEGMLPKSDFMGTGGSADDIVFLCDESGSMLSVFAALREQLKKSISQMAVDENGAQRFNVIFFGDGTTIALFPDGMQLATPENKRKAADFIDQQVPVGGTQPIPAIRAALRERPQLLYVLTDGFDNIADMSTVTDEFKRGDRDGAIHINCIFLQSDDDPKLVEALKEIATIGHGDFKVLLKSDM